jgi:hypothetical protein
MTNTERELDLLCADLLLENHTLRRENAELISRIAALEALMSPPAIIPIADVPVRVVTEIDLPQEVE